MSHFSLSAVTAPLDTPEGLRHAVLQSVLNHREATDNDRARMGSTERGGCWSESHVPFVGSRDWTLGREKNLDTVRRQMAAFCKEALGWMVAQGWVVDYQIKVVEVSANRVDRLIVLTTPTQEQVEVVL